MHAEIVTLALITSGLATYNVIKRNIQKDTPLCPQRNVGVEMPRKQRSQAKLQPIA